LQIKQKIKDEIHADGHANGASELNLWGNDGMEMKPDTKILRDFGLQDGNHISVDFPDLGVNLADPVRTV